MAKYDAVDRLMKMATDETPSSKTTERFRQPDGKRVGERVGEPEGEPEGEAVLEAKITAQEPLPTGGGAMPIPPTAHTEPALSSVDRGRQLLGAIRPFLPVVGSALRLVDHGAVQAVARLLPMLGNLGAGVGSPAPQANPVDNRDHTADALAASEKRHAALAGELNDYKSRVATMEEGQRRMRELVERSVAEQGSLTHSLHQLADRSRLLSAAVIILVMLVVAELVLLTISLHR